MGYFVCTDNLKMQTENAVDKFIGKVPISKSLSVISFTSKNPATPGGSQKLNLYVVSPSDYENPNQISSANIYQVSNKDFISKRDKKVLQR